MTIDQMISVLEAAEAKQQIQSRSKRSGAWLDTDYPTWDFEHREYRVKPKSREVWINVYGDALGTVAYETKEMAECNESTRIIHFVEASDDEP